jgi:hypothetical protein
MSAETESLSPDQLSELDSLVDWEQPLPSLVGQILDLADDVAGFEHAPEDLVSILVSFHMKESNRSDPPPQRDRRATKNQ